MNRWIYVRQMADKYSGLSFDVSVTGESGGAVPHRVVENREELQRLFRQANLEKLLRYIDETHAKGDAYDSGPLNITQEQEDILLGRK